METMKAKTQVFMDAGDPEGPSPEDINAIVAATVFEVTNTLEECDNRRAFMIVRHYHYLESVVRGLALASYQAGIEDTYEAGVKGYEAGYRKGQRDGVVGDRVDSYHNGCKHGHEAGQDQGLAQGHTDGYAAGKERGLKELRKAEGMSWSFGYDCGFVGAVDCITRYMSNIGPKDEG